MKISKALPLFLKALLVFVFAVGSGSLANAATNLPFGQVTTGTIGSAAQTNKYSFSANTGDVIDFTVYATSGTLNPLIQVFTSNGTTPFASADNYSTFYGSCEGGPVELNSVTLPASPGGTYVVWISDCASTNTGGYSIYAQPTNNPSGAANLPLDQTITGTIGSATQSNTYTFSGTANEVVNFDTINTSAGLNPRFRLYKPDGSILKQADNYSTFYGICEPGELEMDTVKLPTTGTYTLLYADCADTNTGNYTLFVQSTNDPVGPITDFVWGEVQPGTVNAVSGLVQSTTYTFNGTADDSLDFTIVPTSGFDPRLSIYNPDGSLLKQADDYSTFYGTCESGNVTMNNVKLPTTGTYIALIDACNYTTGGNYTLSTQCIGACLLPAPVIGSLSPSAALVGSGGFTLTVNGANFAESNATSVVEWEGSPLATTWVSTAQMTAAVPASDLSATGIYSVTVNTPSPGGGTSNSDLFTVYNPAPGASIGIAPTSATAGSAAVPLTVTGTNFVSNSSVMWNGYALATTYVSATKLAATIPAGDLTATTQCANITVNNPAVNDGQPAGGGTSNAQCFTVNGIPSSLTTPAPGSSLSGTSATFSWTAGVGVTKYEFRLGTTGPGSKDVYNAADATTTALSSPLITNIPAYGVTLYARLYSWINGIAQYNDYTYTESGSPVPAVLTSPTPGTTLTGSSATFSWTAGGGVSLYEFRLGTTGPGSSDVYNAAAMRTTALTTGVISVPTYGVTLYARLYSFINGVAQSNDYTYTESGSPVAAVLTSPTPGSPLSGSSATFSWTAGGGNNSYEFRLGTTGPGSSDVYNAAGMRTTALTTGVISVPTYGLTLYARIYSFTSTGASQYKDYTYTESGSPVPATLTSPTPGSTLTGSSATFSWTAGGGINTYEFRLGTTGPGSSDVYNAAGMRTTALTTGVIPVPAYGVTLYARIYSITNKGTSQYNDYTYTESGSPVKAVLTSPTPGSTLTGSSATFSWTAGGGVTKYEFRLGTTGPGSNNVYNASNSTTTALTTGLVTGIPTTGATLYARLYSFINGAWQYNDYTYTEQ